MAAPRAREGQEIWETTTEGTVWVSVVDERNRERAVSVGGKVGSRLRLTALDREIVQDAILNSGSDPFTNGLLRRVDADQNLDPATSTDQAFSTEQLLVLFSKSGNAFQAAVRRLNEVNVRRMADMAEGVDASASQIAFLEALIEEKFRIHGSTPTYDEMMAAPE